MKIELICIGNELLLGKIRDLNGHWLSKECLKHKLDLDHIHIVGDDPEKLKTVLKNAWKAGTIIITSGGLGPTKDDMTKNIISDFFTAPIEYNQQAFDISKNHYDRRERLFDPTHNKYDHIPRGSFPIHNPVGYAPGIGLTQKDKFFFAAPGVPSEFKAMVGEQIIPAIFKHAPHLDTLKKLVTIKTYRIPEEKIFKEICPDLWEQLEQYGTPSSLPHLGGVDIGVVIEGHDQKDLDTQEQEVIQLVTNTDLKKYIWHIGHESLEEVIVQRATQKNLTFGFAESCTGGLNASRITNVSGSSAAFFGAVVSYDNSAKINLLKVKEQTLLEHGAVSEQTALEMAKGARLALGVDIAISTSGIAGPNGGTADKPVGSLAIAISSEKFTSSKLYQFRGDRESLKQIFSQAALFSLLEQI